MSIRFGFDSETAAPAADGVSVGATLDTGDPAWPQAIIDRPLTLPSGVWAVGTDLDSSKSFDTIGDALVLGYGITDELEVGLSYGFSLRDFEAKGDVALDAGYALYREGKFELIGRGALGYSIAGEDLLPIGLGIQGQYTHNDRFAVVMPAEHLSIGIAMHRELLAPLWEGAKFGRRRARSPRTATCGVRDTTALRSSISAPKRRLRGGRVLGSLP